MPTKQSTHTLRLKEAEEVAKKASEELKAAEDELKEADDRLKAQCSEDDTRWCRDQKVKSRCWLGVVPSSCPEKESLAH